MNQAKPSAHLGFLTVLGADDQGLIGGYLILTSSGRPLEFHCTAPVKPNRAQQILFGPTLDPYLYGEQIGQTLIAKGSAMPLAVCTDVVPALTVRDFVPMPVVYVVDAAAVESSAELTDAQRIETAQAHAGLRTFSLGRHRLAVAARHASDEGHFLRQLSELGLSEELFDLCEPFGRIREALAEAHKPLRASA